MNLRTPLLMAAAAAFLMVGTGCESSKTKAEISSLMTQNRELQAKLEAESAARAAADARAQAATEAASRTPTVVQSPAPADMGGGNLVDLRGPAGRPARPAPADLRPAPTQDAVLELKGDVLFDSGTATIKTSAQKELDALASKIKQQYAGKTLVIEGHTDATPLKSTSKWKSNKELGEARAKAVMAYLAKKGVPSKSMQAVSLGSSQPKSTKDQAQNRRVEIVVKNAT
jgi:flagellar motor protein MotB